MHALTAITALPIGGSSLAAVAILTVIRRGLALQRLAPLDAADEYGFWL